MAMSHSVTTLSLPVLEKFCPIFTAFSSTCDASSNFRLFAKSSFKNLTAFGIYERASINGLYSVITGFGSLWPTSSLPMLTTVSGLGYLVVIQKSTWRAVQSEFRAPGLMLVDF
ncbi:hypothetical protein GOBAR_AA32779 [Gossypium barbadense]|uniref:Uncharacterized protein n=1 Tax=Gossypium barbadense TaxID=3634 RepID=A0A2P5WA12_GOSBA|nr:hypothetical protein GOBAR_AA32779 [Gossypium barbadense]